MRNLMINVLAAAAVVGLAGCSDDDDNGGDVSVNDDQDSSAPAVLSVAQAGRFQVSPFAFDEGAAEILAYDPSQNRLFVVNSDARTVDVLDINDVDNIQRLPDPIDATEEGAAANSVAVSGGVLAVAIEADDAQAPGEVVFYATTGLEKRGEATVGALPDMVTFTPDGTRVLVANEGEPNDEYTNDPEGSVSVIDVSNGFESAPVETLDFTGFNDQADALRERGVHIFGPDASVAQDLEPEYIAVNADGSRAYVSLQENNAIAELDLDNLEVSAIRALGFKDHSVAGQGIDPSNVDGFNVREVPVLGMYQPDTIATFSQAGTQYILTANEGDARDYDGFSEEADVADLELDAEAFPNAAMRQTEAELGDLQVTNVRGDTDGDGDFDALFAFGARSFSIRDADTGELVFDSGNALEQITGNRYGDDFNNDNDENDGDSRSDNKGPEPEAIAHGRIGDRDYAFIGLERMGGFLVYEITDVVEPVFVTYINNRDLDANPENGQAGDLGPESIVFIGAEDSPVEGTPLLAVGNEISGSTTLYRLRFE
jgi:DNA-binding beta-propeller fold protein YncE